MIAHGVAGTQIKDAAVLPGLQAGPAGLTVEGFAQIFQQKTETFAASLSVDLAGDVPVTGSLSPIKPASPIKEGPELPSDPSKEETMLKTIQQEPPIAIKALVASPSEQIAGKEALRTPAKTKPNADMLTTKDELVSGQPLSETKPSALPTESPAPESIQVVPPTTGSVFPAITSARTLSSQVQIAADTKPAHLPVSGRKDNSEKAVDGTRKEYAHNYTPQIKNVTVSDAPVVLVLSPVTLAAPAQQLQSLAGWKSEPEHVQTTFVASDVVTSTENPPLNQQAKNAHAVVPPSALNGEVKSVERLNSSTDPVASKHTIDSQKDVSAPALEPVPLAALGHSTALPVSPGASIADRIPMDTAPMQAATIAVTHGGVSNPHGALSLDGSSEPLVAMSLPDVAHTTLSATPTSLEVGVANSSHGWLKIRAELTEKGDVSASLTGGSSGAAEKLRSDLPALSSYLEGEKVQVSSISIHSAVVTTSAGSSEAQSPSALFERSGNDSTSSLTAGFGEGRQDGQPQQPSGDASSERQPVIQESGEGAGLTSSSTKDVGTYGAERRQGLDGSAALPSVEYGAGGGWLNVRA